MQSSTPAVSIGMPVYNGERYIEEAIRSNLEQTFRNFELIISDNASTDGTREICEHAAAQDSRIRYLHNEVNVGAAANYNLLVHRSRAPLFRWSNADDLLEPQLIERCYSVLAKRPDVVLAYGKTTMIDEHGVAYEEYEDKQDIQSDCAVERFKLFYERVALTNIIYGLMRRDAMLQTPLMGKGTVPAGDYRFMAALVLVGKFVEIPERLFYRRMHPEASSWDRADENRQTAFWSAADKGFFLPRLRSELTDIRSIMRSPTSTAEKARLLLYVFRRIYWFRGPIIRELTHDLVWRAKSPTLQK